MTAEVFTVATEATPGFVRFQSSLAHFGVPVTVLGQGDYYAGHCWRWKKFINGAKKSSAELVLHCDSYDSVCVGSLEDAVTKFAALSASIVFSYDPQERPGFSLNPGLMMANREALLAVFSDQTLEDFFPDHFNDQCQIQSMCGWNPSLFSLDTEGALFYTLNQTTPDLLAQNNKLVNPATGKAPSFVHAPYGRDISAVEQWLASTD